MDYLTCDPKYLYYKSLNMWANCIETGDPSISAEVALKGRYKEIVKVLTDDQKRMVLRLRDEASLVLQAL